MERVDSLKSLAIQRIARRFATSSRSTRTRNCRAIRPGKWSGRWPIRSIDPCWIQRRRVVAGYGIMQPRVGVSLPSAQRSWFVRLFAGDAGVDPYTRVVSDLYQDLFGEGSFVGKGIYDVDAFEQCCGNFPENTILSHDLLESAYVRSALLSDVELYEEFPSRYPGRRQLGDSAGYAATGRLPGGCCPRVPARQWKSHESRSARYRGGRSLTTSVGAWCRWRCCRVLLLSWLLLGPALAAGVTLFMLAVVGAVPLLAVLSDLVRKPTDLPLLTHLSVTASATGKTVRAVPVHVCFPPLRGLHQCRCDRANPDADALDEEGRCWSGRPPATQPKWQAPTWLGFFRTMWFGPAITAI